ncbi:uncharacterized protein LOC110020897 [Phalaenopsis equestris]|uniref:uncharacterized protein LOC110020897 n=1 Tax=Phalaenopsis equestris TaxID=78828 RepID=UPI0009E45379|nr:uncharacterized protein LOC110020897 [Phalaenopsis equestris]XP_020574838.1 uncharacterized protein LOC110020897 [Phalaenopsis equestris]
MSARPQVTITLGQTGQVVKRTTTTVDVSSSGYYPSSEGKRSLRERLGNNTESHHENQFSKRQRTNNYNPSNNHMVDERHRMSNGRVSRNDLRHKLMSKGLSRGKSGSEEQIGVDLREKLSRNSRILLRKESNQNLPESRISSLSRRIPPARSADDLLRLDSSRKPYPLTSDGQRCRSPDGLIGAYRRISPLRCYDEAYNTSLIRPYGDSRPTGHVTRSFADTSRPAPFMSKAIPVDAAKPILRAPPDAAQKPVILTEVPLTVASLLHSLGLGKYAIHFQAEEVDMAALRQMGDNDLKELGIPMGPRKKILLALLQRSKHRLH